MDYIHLLYGIMGNMKILRSYRDIQRKDISEYEEHSYLSTLLIQD